MMFHLMLVILHCSVLIIGVTIDYESVEEECCYRMAHLAKRLFETQRTLRCTKRFRIALLTSRKLSDFYDENMTLRKRVAAARAFIGADTIEWGSRVALWGIVPLWEASPSPDTILTSREPKPSDCWPFSGSHGEVIIELAHKTSLEYISLEHVRPDTAFSAPENFIVYSLLENGTRVVSARGTYTYKKPPKQYFPLNIRIPVNSVAFKVLNNQGNRKYTCIYRLHLYGSDV